MITVNEEIPEGPYPRPLRKIYSFPDEVIEVVASQAYMIWLVLKTNDGTKVAAFAMSPHQVSRIGKHLLGKVWKGGIICPYASYPHCVVGHMEDKLGLNFHTDGTPEVVIEWLPNDPQAVGERLLVLTGKCYAERVLKPEEPKQDLTQWIHSLFGV